MASIIRIKRSSVSGNPTTLAAGELAYSALTDNGSNGGDRLYIGIGSETGGNAANHFVIGGKFFTDRLDHTAGTLTASSAIVVDSNSKIDNLLVDNLQLNGSTLSTTNTNGDLYITPNGSGKTVITGLYIGDTSTSLAEYIQDVTGGQIVDSSEILASYDDGAGTTSLSLATTTVTAGDYGSSTKIPTFTVDSKGRLTAAGEADVATSLNVYSDGGTTQIDILTQPLMILGGTGITTDATSTPFPMLTVSAKLATDSTIGTAGVAYFDATNFSVDTLGGVTSNGITVNAESGSASTNLGGSLIIQGVIGGAVTTSASGGTVYIDVPVASDTFAGVASFGSEFSVDTLGAVSLATGGIANSKLENSSINLGTTTLTLGDTVTSVSGLTLNGVNIDNLSINGNTITSTDTNGDIVLNPNGTGTVDVSNSRITGVSDPIDGADAANKAYVDNAVSGLTYKDAVNLLADSNVSLTGSTSTLVIDGHAALDSADDGIYRILLTGQTTDSENGIYLYTDNGTSYELVRSGDADTYQELIGTSVFVMEGTAYANTGWVQSNHYLTDFTNQSWTQFSGAGAYTAGNGLTQSGTIFNVGQGDGITVDSDSVSLATSVAGDGLSYSSGVLNVNVAVGGGIAITADYLDIATDWLGQSSITTLGTITTGTWNATTIAVNKGGTGLTSYSAGDLLYATGATTLAKLSAGSEGKFLQINASGLPIWGDIDGGVY